MFNTDHRKGIILENFGIGSVFGFQKKFLVIEVAKDSVSIVDLKTFTLVTDLVKVKDPIHLTKEVSKLANLAGECCTFNENSFYPRGIKTRYSNDSRANSSYNRIRATRAFSG